MAKKSHGTQSLLQFTNCFSGWHCSQFFTVLGRYLHRFCSTILLKVKIYKSYGKLSLGLLICTLISENQGHLRKISGSANLDFFSVCRLDFFQVYSINLAFFLGGDLEKKSRFAGPEIFLRFETCLDFWRPGSFFMI